MVVYIYYITAAGNSISLQLGSSCQGNWYGMEKSGGTPVHHIQDHTCQIILLQPVRLVAVLGQPSRTTFNPHQNDQGRKGPCCFQRLIALKCLKCQKISNPPLVSYLSNEPNFLLIK